MWAALRYLGKRGVGEQIEQSCQLAVKFATLLKDGGCEVLNDVVLNQVLVAFKDDDMTQKVIEAVQEEGVCWCGGTIWKNKKAMRISVCSWATRPEDVEMSAHSIIATFQRLLTDTHEACLSASPETNNIQPEPGIHQTHHRVRMRDGEHMLGGETGLSSGRVVIQFQSDGG